MKKNNYLQLIISVLALLTAMTPYMFKYIESIKLGVTYNSVESAKEQSKLWEKNIDCLIINKDKFTIQRADNSTISIIVCKSGDILLDYATIDNQRNLRWIDFNSIKSTGLSAQIQQQQLINKKIIQIEQQDNNMIIIEKVNNKCFEIIIFKPTGEVISKKEIICKS